MLVGNRYESDEVAAKNLMMIRGSFAILVMKVLSKLATMNIDMDEFLVFIDNLFPENFTSSKATMAEIFRSISHNNSWYYLNCEPIVQIHKAFIGEDDELSKLIKSYKLELLGFKASTKIIDFIKACKQYEKTTEKSIEGYKKDCHTLEVKLNVKITEECLDYLDHLWKSFAEEFHIPLLPVVLEKISIGCAEITYFSKSSFHSQISTTLSSTFPEISSHQIYSG